MHLFTRSAACLAAWLILSVSAFAHSQSEKTVPADGATVAKAERLELSFDKPMRVTSFRLYAGDDEAGVERETGMEPVTSFKARPAESLKPGSYRVDWRGLSDDGHPMNGSYSFTVSD